MADGVFSEPRAALAAPRPNWFSDLAFHWDASVTVLSSGVRITLRELTAMEVAKFITYFAVVVWQGARARLSGQPKHRVWFTPSIPRPWYVVWSALTLAGVRIARDEADADAVFYFEDVTIGAPPRLLHGAAINAGCADISKSRVAKAFAAAAGYPLALDPETHTGVAVEKSEENGRHDGRLVTCPATPRAGKVYQHLVDSAVGDTAFDLRTTVIGRRPLFVLEKTKPAADRFSIHNATVTYRTLEEVFSAAEIALITRFAEEMQLDWAALDILRDCASGRIYVVDVNKTDTGPAVDLSWGDRERLKATIAHAFAALVASHAAIAMTHH